MFLHSYMTEITKLSSKGQIVIPTKIRESLQLEEGSRLLVDRFHNLIILKKTNISDLKEEFKRLTKKGEKIAKEKDIKNEEEVIKRIHKGRGIIHA